MCAKKVHLKWTSFLPKKGSVRCGWWSFSVLQSTTGREGDILCGLILAHLLSSYFFGSEWLWLANRMSVHWFGILEKKRRSFGWAQCPGLYLGNVLWVLTWSPFCWSTVVMEDSTCITWVSGWYLALVLLVVCIFLACLCGLTSHVGCINTCETLLCFFAMLEGLFFVTSLVFCCSSADVLQSTWSFDLDHTSHNIFFCTRLFSSGTHGQRRSINHFLCCMTMSSTL
jgi:hypothetical protein